MLDKVKPLVIINIMKYITLEMPDSDEIAVFEESENWKDAQDQSHCWVWQEAESKEQAVSRHMEKFDQWEEDMESGKEIKDFY